MKFEHFAINVPEPKEMAEWYEEYIGLNIAFQLPHSPYTTFMSDDSGRLVMEVYNNPNGPMLEFDNNHHPLTFHMAFESEDAEVDKNRLIKAGAKFFDEMVPDEESHLVMMKDPWGVPVQICQRKEKIV